MACVYFIRPVLLLSCQYVRDTNLYSSKYIKKFCKYSGAHLVQTLRDGQRVFELCDIRVDRIELCVRVWCGVCWCVRVFCKR